MCKKDQGQLRRILFDRLLPFLFLTFAQASGALQQCFSQTPGVYTIRLEKGSLLHAVEQVRTVTGSNIVFREADISGLMLPAQQFSNATVLEILKELVKPFPLKVEKKGTVYFIEKKEPPVNPSLLPGPRITGIVKDSATGMPVSGAAVRIEGGAGAQTDAEGRFILKAHKTRGRVYISHIGYASQTITVPPDSSVELTVILKIGSASLQTVAVVAVLARRKLNTELSLLNERKNLAVVSDGISAENMAKLGSITSTQALTRVAGVSITDDKYVAIRGIGDRSVVAELNGARLSSSDPDRSAVPLDIVPASLLDNINIYKTLSPDRPADASAGIVELKTKSVPDSLTVVFTVQAGFNSTVGLNGKFNAFRNYQPGYWGQMVKQHELSADFKALAQQYPGGPAQITQLMNDSRNSPQLSAEAFRINKILQRFDPVMTSSYQPASLNQVYSASFGNAFRVFGGHKLGVILALSYYNRTEDRYHAELNQYSIYQGVVTGSSKILSPLHIPASITPNNITLGKYIGYQENTGTQTINYGGLAALTYQFNNRNEVQFQYLGSRGAQVQGSSLTGAFQNTGTNYIVNNQINQLKQNYRTFDTYNLQGEHSLVHASWSPRLSYNLSSSRSYHTEPDFRFSDIADKNTQSFVDQNGQAIGSHYYAFVVGQVHGIGPAGTINADPNGRRYRYLLEHNYNLRADLTQPFSVRGFRQEFKIGVNYLKRDRNFNENVISLPGTGLPGQDNGMLQKANGNLNALVAYNNIGLGPASSYNSEGQARSAGYIYQTLKSPNNYSGKYETRAFYAMIDARVGKQFRFNGGVRFESTDIRADVDTIGVNDLVADQSNPGGPIVYRKSSNPQPHTAYQQDYKPFYSANLIYNFRNQMNFRLAYSTSLARPELRELTNIYEFDPFQFAVVMGNPNLKNQTTKSYDFRWEWFPKPGEVISASVFYKRIENQLTKTFIQNSPGKLSQAPEFPIVVFVNDPNIGKVMGIELELRKNLGVLWPGFRDLFFGTNLMLASSVIDKNPDRIQASRIIDRLSPGTSPLFEQAPYTVNAYLDYDNRRSGTNITASFNIIGERLVQVQLDGAPDIYDRPVPMMDIVFSQKFWKRWAARGFAKNILNPYFQEVYALPGTGGKYRGQTYTHHRYLRGAEFSLGLTYNLF